jgi:hypothetical protein
MATAKNNKAAKTATKAKGAKVDKVQALVVGANALQRALFTDFGAPVANYRDLCTNKNAATMLAGLVVGSVGGSQATWQCCANVLGAYMATGKAGVQGICKGALNANNTKPSGGYYVETNHSHVLSASATSRPLVRAKAFEAIDAFMASSERVTTLVNACNARFQACNHTDLVASVEGTIAHWQDWQKRKPKK